MGDFYNYGYGYEPGYAHMSGIGAVFMVIFAVLVIWLIIAIIKMAIHGHISSDSINHAYSRKYMGEMQNGDKALDILKERFAKGDITMEEFEEKKKILLS